MARILLVGTLLATILLVICLLLAAAGLVMGARPDVFADLGIKEADKVGFVLALLAGFGAIASTVSLRILYLMLDSLDEEADT